MSPSLSVEGVSAPPNRNEPSELFRIPSCSENEGEKFLHFGTQFVVVANTQEEFASFRLR